MSHNPTITAVIPTYNRVHTLARALDSIQNQTIPVSDIIVVDDGSTDGTSQFVRQLYPHVTLLQQLNQGVSHARNQGINASTSGWIALLDSDDQWHPQKIEKQLKCLSENPDMILCHTNETWMRNGKHVNQMKKHTKTGGQIFAKCLPLCAISPSSSLIRSDIFDECGLFDETLPACEDYDMWLRICSRYVVHYIDEPLTVKYGGHDDQLSQKYWGMDRFRVQALHNILGQHILQPEQRIAAIETLLEKCDILISGAKKRNNSNIANYFSQIAQQYRYSTAITGNKQENSHYLC